MLTSYKEKKTAFDTNFADFETKRAAYEKDLETAKNSPPDAATIARITANHDALLSQFDSLNKSQDEINGMVDPLNAAGRKKSAEAYAAAGGPSIGEAKPSNKIASDQPTATDFGQEGSGLPVITSKVPGESIPVIGKMLSAGKEGYNVIANTLNDGGNRLVSALKSFTPGKDNTDTITDKAVKILSATSGALGVAWLPVSATLKSAEGIPVVGHLAQGVNYLFGKLGELGNWEAGTIVNSLPISDTAKQKVTPVAAELAGLLNQIAGGKVIHETAADVTERSNAAYDLIAEKKAKGIELSPTETKLERIAQLRTQIKDEIVKGYEGIKNLPQYIAAKNPDFLKSPANMQGGFIKIPGSGPDEFQGLPDLSTNIVEKLKNRSTVSKQFISDLTNSADVKQQERDVIRKVLDTYPDGQDIPVSEFAHKVQDELLPLERNSLTKNKGGVRYENIALPDETRGPVSNYSENIYSSPVETSAGDIHFNGSSPEGKGYFGHSRVEDLPGGTRRVIEVQSDLYQKDRLATDWKDNAEMRKAIRIQEEKDLPLYNSGKMTAEEHHQNIADIQSKFKAAHDKNTAPLAQYNNPTAHFRMVREEVKQAAVDGKKTLLFPTGDTAMKIEGLGSQDRWYLNPHGDEITFGGHELEVLTPEKLKVGLVIGGEEQGDAWVVTDVLGAGRFVAIPKQRLDYYNSPGFKRETANAAAGGATKEQYLENDKETFDISGKIDTNNPIYRFYEKDLGRYLKNNFKSEIITDTKGVTWHKVDITPEMATKPVTAFKLGDQVTGGFSATEIRSSLAKIFGKDVPFKGIDDPAFMSRPDAIGEMANATIKVLSDNGTFSDLVSKHEAWHYFKRVLASAAERAEIKVIEADVSKSFPKKAAELKKSGYTEKQIAEELVSDEFARFYRTGKTFSEKVKIFFDKVVQRIEFIFKNKTGILAYFKDIKNKGTGGESFKAPPVFKLSERTPGRDLSETERQALLTETAELKGKIPKAAPAARDMMVKRLTQITKQLRQADAIKQSMAARAKQNPADTSTPRPVQVNDFGPVHEGTGQEAVDTIAKEGGQIQGALEQPEIGKIDLIAGKANGDDTKGYGILKIAKKHPEMIPVLADELKNSHIVERLPERDVLLSADGKYKFVVDHQFGREKKTWLNNAYSVPGKGLEPSTSPVSEERSTIELPRHGTNIANPVRSVNEVPVDKVSSLANDYIILTPEKGDRQIIESGIQELKKIRSKAALEARLKIKLPTELEQRALALENNRETIEANPMKKLVRYMARTGEFKGRLNEVTGGAGKGLFARTGDRVISEITGINDSETAWAEFEKYMETRRRFEADMLSFQRDKQSFLKEARAKRDQIIEDQKIGRMHTRTERHISEMLTEKQKKLDKNNALIAKETAKQAELKQKEVDLSSYQKKVEAAHLKEAEKKTLLAKFKAIMAPIEQTDPTTKKIYLDWESAKLKAKEDGNKAYEEFKNKPNDNFGEIMDYEAGKRTPWVFTAFEDLYTEARRASLTISHKDDYIPHVYNEKADIVKKAVTKYMEDQKVSKDVIKSFQEGNALPDKLRVNVKIHPFFEKIRTFPDYRTAMKYGLTPRFHTIAEHIAFYKEELGKIVANKDMISNLIKEGKVLDANDAPAGWVELKLPGRMRRTYYAERNLADALNGQFRDPESLTFTQEIVHRLSKASGAIQNVVIAGGIPSTTINNFAIGSAIRMLTTGLGDAAKLDFKGASSSVKAAGAFIRANFTRRSITWLKDNQKYIDLMNEHNTPVFRKISDYTELNKQWSRILTARNAKEAGISIKTAFQQFDFKKPISSAVTVGKEILDSRGAAIPKDVFNKAVNEKTMSSMLPQMQIQIFKDIYEAAVKDGTSEKEAAAFAAAQIRNEFGLAKDLGRTQTTKDFFGAFFFAPRFREGMINVFVNAAKGWTSEFSNPAFGRSRSLGVGMVLTFALYNYLNYKMNGGVMWNNEPGREFSLKIPLPSGRIVYTEFMPSSMAFLRNIGSGLMALGQGDGKTATQKFGSLFSTPVKSASEVISNSDYFGRPIWDITDSPMDKAKKAAAYMGLSISHPYFKELVRYYQGKQDLFETFVTMTEMPLKFSNEEKAAMAREYQAKQAKTDLNARERKKIDDVVNTYDQVQKLKADGKTDEAGAMVNGLSDAEYSQYQAVMKYEEIQALRKARQTDAAKTLLQNLTDDEYLQYNAIKTLRSNATRTANLKKKADQKARPIYTPGEKIPATSILESIKTYADAIGTDPVTAFNRIFTGQRIRRVDNGAIIVERMSLFNSSKVKTDQGGNNPTMKLDHTIPLELGGDNSLNNLKLVPTADWESYTPVENKLGALLRAGKISKTEAQSLINRFKNGDIPATDILKL